MANVGDNQKRVLLVSVPRTASNLLLKILNISGQPNVHTSPSEGYFLYKAYMAAIANNRLMTPLGEWAAEDKAEVRNAFQASIDRLEDFTATAREKKNIMFTKEHAFWLVNPGFFCNGAHGTSEEYLKTFQVTMPESYGASQTFSSKNKTVLSDEYLRTWKPAFIIRHPALAWPSMYRAMIKMRDSGIIEDEDVKGASITNMSFHWTRELFEWYLEQADASVAPLVIDAHQVIHDRAAVAKFSELAGLDPASLRFEWDSNTNKSDNWAPTGNGENAEVVAKQRKSASIMASTLEGSSGIEKAKAPESVDIDVEVGKWKVEFGEEAAQTLEKATRDAMPDYEYLKSKRVTA